jgi:two-component system phosphate regulon sensor histidine kinase PhoR
VDHLPAEASGRFLAFPDSAMEARISADGDGLIVHANKRAESMFGYTTDELLGQPLAMLMPERFREAHHQGLARFRQEGQSSWVGRTVELIALRRDGQEFPVELALASWGGGGSGVLFFGNLRDITVRKQAEEEHQRLLAELRNLSTARERLLEDVAHELRGPLTSLGLTIDMRRELEPDQMEDLMTRAGRAVARLQRLVDDMLDARSIQEGRFQVAPRRINAGELLAAAVEEAEPVVENAGQRLECSSSAARVAVLADRPHAVRAILNLLSNASKYTPSGGTIRLTTELAGAELRIAVLDRGPGVPIAQQEHLFERFYRAPSHRQRPGVGLGLAIVKGVAEAHGGSVGVDSQPGQGSCFWFSLPLASPPRRSGRSRSSPTGG